MKKLIILLFYLISFSTLSHADEFPGRIKYPEVPIIELIELYQQRKDIIIVDSRSSYEYETLRIKNAINIPVSLRTEKFRKKVQALHDENPDKMIVFYCNGHNCMKSYKATRKSMTFLGLKNVASFDAGVFDWAKTYPNEALLLGKTLKNSNNLISKAEFKKHLLSAEKFIKSADSNVEILDIRDRIDTDGFYIFSRQENSISLNSAEQKKLEKLLDNVKKNEKTLYVYDMVGKQVRWFQYYIESKGIKNYYFMEGGAEAFFKIPLHKLIDQG